MVDDCELCIRGVQSVSLSSNQSVSQPVCQSVNQPFCQPASQSLTLSVSQSVSVSMPPTFWIPFLERPHPSADLLQNLTAVFCHLLQF